MEKKMNNKGFSLVELIIVVAIMAVLIGVLAPAYLQYVEKSKKTKDLSAVGSVLDSLEIIAADPGVAWDSSGAAKKIEIKTSGAASYDTPGSDPVLKALDNIADGATMTLSGAWGKNIIFTAKKQTNGTVVFTLDGAGVSAADINAISPALGARFKAAAGS